MATKLPFNVLETRVYIIINSRR